MEYIRTHLQSIIAIAPRREALETPIKVEKTKYQDYRYKWDNVNGDKKEYYMATRTKILDNNNG
tara:strand:+ start:329 stop:520 length:192 start_codon:yes stop_codon:yes gene_type:complete